MIPLGSRYVLAACNEMTESLQVVYTAHFGKRGVGALDHTYDGRVELCAF